jgi:hypothetical protein
VVQDAPPDSIVLFERATRHAEAVMARVTPEQLAHPTPCSAWTVQDLVDHMVGATDYLSSALAGHPPRGRSGTSVVEYREGVIRVLAGLRLPGALDRSTPGISQPRPGRTPGSIRSSCRPAPRS